MIILGNPKVYTTYASCVPQLSPLRPVPSSGLQPGFLAMPVALEKKHGMDPWRLKLISHEVQNCPTIDFTIIFWIWNCSGRMISTCVRAISCLMISFQHDFIEGCVFSVIKHDFDFSHDIKPRFIFTTCVSAHLSTHDIKHLERFPARRHGGIPKYLAVFFWENKEQ